VVRTLAAMRKDAPRALVDLAANGEDITRLRVGPLLVFLVNSPEPARQVLESADGALQRGRGERRVAARFLGQGLMASEDPLHGRQRAAIAPVVHGESVRSPLDEVLSPATRMADRWEEGAPLDALAEMTRVGHDIVQRLLFGLDVDEPEGRHLRDAIDASVRALEHLFLPFSSAAASIPLPSNRRFARARAEVDRLLSAMIEERIRGTGPPNDILGALVSAPPEGAGMEPGLARDEALTLFRGSTGTGTALAWCLYLLASHPEAQDRLHTELDSVLEGRDPSARDLPDLRYARMVFSEAMRMYPPVWIVSRVAMRDQVIAGRRIPKGSRVLASPYVLHHDPRAWPDPDRFDPERFASGPVAEGGPSYVPFGGGPKRCMGDELATTVGIVVLAAIGRKWRLRLAPGARVTYSARATLKPTGLQVVPDRR
jgi:cytochrome P450